MITQLAVGMIIALCEGDTRMYLVQDYKTECIEFYTSCVSNHSWPNTADKKHVEECKDEAETKLVK